MTIYFFLVEGFRIATRCDEHVRTSIHLKCRADRSAGAKLDKRHFPTEALDLSVNFFERPPALVEKDTSKVKAVGWFTPYRLDAYLPENCKAELLILLSQSKTRPLVVNLETEHPVEGDPLEIAITKIGWATT
jgi:hypothetical protein